MSSPSHILVVEDSPTQAVLLQHILESAGHRSALATNGSRALEAARAAKPRLVISDVEMPVMDGYEMCRRLKADPALRDVPVVLLTSLRDAADVVRGLEVGADHYLTKPYEPDWLLARVEAVMNQPTIGGSDGNDTPIDVPMNGRHHRITAGRSQILNLLLSTYGNAVQRNTELLRAQLELTRLNQQLAEQTAALKRQNQLLDQTAQSEHRALEQLKQAQAHLVQSEKLAGLGQMVAGIAHEINNPLAFVGNNIAVLQRDVSVLCQLLDLYRAAEELVAARPDLLEPIRELAERLDLAYTIPNLQDLFGRSLEGLRRIRQIVKDLRDFARLDESDLHEVDLNAGVESTINIVRGRADEKQVRIEIDLRPMPAIACYPAKINQALMNLIVNGIEASRPDGVVTVRTQLESGFVRIDVVDTGVGIDPAIRDKIFDPFFTTKPPGQGTGLGLSIAYGIIRDHQGRIEVDSQVGRYSQFSVFLPLGTGERPRS